MDVWSRFQDCLLTLAQFPRQLLQRMDSEAGRSEL
jgi:hypothetical protein